MNSCNHARYNLQVIHENANYVRYFCKKCRIYKMYKKYSTGNLKLVDYMTEAYFDLIQKQREHRKKC